MTDLLTPAEASRRVEVHLARRGYHPRVVVESSRVPGDGPLFPGMMLTRLRTVRRDLSWTSSQAATLVDAVKGLPGLKHTYLRPIVDEVQVFWDDRPTYARESDYVRLLLAGQGFSGHVAVTSWRDGNRVTTEVKQGDGSVPWTVHVHNWLVETLSELPGYAHVACPVPGVLRVTWAGRARR